MAAGYPVTGAPPPIVYTADIFDAEALDLVLKHGIHVNCGSPDMIDQLGRVAPGREITLRLNPGFGHGHSQKTNTGGEQSKHGIWHTHLTDCLRAADHHGLAVTGLHMHIGSGTDLAHLAQVCGAMEQAAREVGRTLTSISAGGGLPIPYREGEGYVDLAAYFKLWDDTRRRLADHFGHKLHLEIEPGRYLVAESGYLVTQIRAIKRMGANTFYLVDAGFNNLARPILYGAYHPMSIVPCGQGGPTRPLHEVIVGGPLCESGDIFTQEAGGFVRSRMLPVAEVGEYLVIECAGAYGFVMGSNYNSKPLAAEVLVENGQAREIRRRQTFDELVAGETIPRN
jgi:diaminopimelate decarboxylase